MESWSFDAELWQWDATAATSIFLTVPEDVSEEIGLLSGPARGFGSVRVSVTVGETTWKTSVFPTTDGYVLPMKKEVRREESLEIGDVAHVLLSLA